MKHLTMMGILTLAALVVGCDKVEQAEQKTKLEVTRSEPQSAKVGAISENLKSPSGDLSRQMSEQFLISSRMAV